MKLSKSRSAKAGFSLTELSIVVVILGVLAMMGVPKYNSIVESSKATEAYVYLTQIQAAQERRNARTGEYARRLSDLDITLARPPHFRIGPLKSFSWQTEWQLRLYRDGASTGYGEYSICFTQNGFDAGRSSIPDEFAPNGRGGELVSAGAVRGSTASNNQVLKPTGNLKWGKDTPMNYDEYLDRVLGANHLDYKKGEDNTLDTFLWLGNIIDQIFNGGVHTQDEWDKDFFAQDRKDYTPGEDYWEDAVFNWHYQNMRYQFGW